MVWTLSNRCSVAETVFVETGKTAERFDSTSQHREGATALRPHERWDLTV